MINKQPWQIKYRCKPADHGNNVEGFEPEHIQYLQVDLNKALNDTITLLNAKTAWYFIFASWTTIIRGPQHVGLNRLTIIYEQISKRVEVFT